MSGQERLRHVIDEAAALRRGVPADREAALLAVLQARDRQANVLSEHVPDLITGRRLADLGGSLALRICFEEPDDGAGSDDVDLDGWAERLLEDCDQLAEAELVLGHGETGFMRLVENDDGSFAAWIATKRAPVSWRERADFDWWAASLANRADPDHRMAYQLSYPDDAELGGCTIQVYREVLRALIALVRDRDKAAQPMPELELAGEIAGTTGIGADAVLQALTGFTLDQENAAYHAAVPGVAAAPLVRIGRDQIVLSRYGLTAEPLLFLTRELRRRDAQEYNNRAFLREDVFRRDLYALFEDKRFVTSANRIQLRREAGNLRTDIDAAVFDRKSGTLAIFELKSQDPFARSTAELQRQRDNVLYANRQISGTLDWIKRHGADEILARIDSRAAKTFKAQKVYPFVLGRYLAHFNDGAPPDPRAAWATWPQLLRLLDSQPVRATDSNPIASLFARLSKDTGTIAVPVDLPFREIKIGETLLNIYPSYAAYHATRG